MRVFEKVHTLSANTPQPHLRVFAHLLFGTLPYHYHSPGTGKRPHTKMISDNIRLLIIVTILQKLPVCQTSLKSLEYYPLLRCSTEEEFKDIFSKQSGHQSQYELEKEKIVPVLLILQSEKSETTTPPPDNNVVFDECPTRN